MLLLAMLLLATLLLAWSRVRANARDEKEEEDEEARHRRRPATTKGHRHAGMTAPS